MTDIQPGGSYKGQCVAIVLGQNEQVVVYTTTDSQLRWSFLHDGAIDARHWKAIGRFDTLMAEVRSTLPEERRKPAYELLGKELFAALSSLTHVPVDELFKGTEALIGTKPLRRARLTYVLAHLSASAVLSLIGVAVGAWLSTASPEASLVSYGSVAGVIGSTISVLLRSGNLNIDESVGLAFLVVQGAGRAFLGFLFGGTFVLASYGDLVAGFLKGNEAGLLVGGMAAGLSERFIPELMKRIEAAS